VRLEACILAGGLSTRMGRNKARLRLGGRTLLAHVKAAAQGAGLPVRVIREDLVPRCGPLGGVYTALQTSRAQAILFLACDMPLVSPALLLRLRDRFEARARAVFLVQRTRPGFPFILDAAALKVVQAQLADGDCALHGLARRLGAATLRLGRRDSHLACNVNTPEDYEAALRLKV
jgi:molybdopterin-guanine dinucleotide biosynthesis protein A